MTSHQHTPDQLAEQEPTHGLMVITSVQGYCTCGQWGRATDGGLDRLRELHAVHASSPPATYPCCICCDCIDKARSVHDEACPTPGCEPISSPEQSSD